MIRVVGCCDVGGSTLRVALADRAGTLLAKQSFSHALPDPHATVATIARVLDELTESVDDIQLLAVGAAVPGPLDPTTGIVHFSPNLRWRDFPFSQALGALIGLPVALDDDANCAALGEQWRGAAADTERDIRDFLYVVVGTGIGAGLFLDGKIYRGAHGFAGELGHTTILRDGPLCSCGKRGCLEALAAGPAIVVRAIEALARPNTSQLVANDLTAHGVIAAARAGDALAREVIESTGQALGVGIANAVNLLNPELVVVGGGVALDAGELLLAPARTELARRPLAPAVDSLKLVTAVLGDDAGLIGAARLAWQARD